MCMQQQPNATHRLPTNNKRYHHYRSSWRVRDARSIEEILSKASEGIDALSPGTIAAVWSQIAKLLSKSQASRPLANPQDAQCKANEMNRQVLRISSILDRTMKLLKTLDAKALATIILGMAKIVKHICSVDSKRSSIYLQAFSSVLLDGTAKPDERTFQSLAEAANNKLLSFDARCLSNLAYAYALLGYDPNFEDGTTLLRNIAPVACSKLPEFEPQGLANTTWAFATLEASKSLLLHAGDYVAMMPSLRTFEEQHLANMAYAFAKAEVKHDHLYQRIGDEIVSREDMNKFKPQELSNALWAFAKSNTMHKALFQQVGDAVVTRDLGSFVPQDFANTVWAYATANFMHSGMFEKMAFAITSRTDLSAFTSQHLSNIVHAYSTANAYHPKLFERIGDEIVARGLRSFSPQEFSNAAYAFASANEVRVDLFEIIGRAINTIAESDGLKSFDSQHLTNIAWSFAVANMGSPLIFGDGFIQALLDNQDELTTAAASQLHQWNMWQTAEKSLPGFNRAEKLSEQCRESFLDASTRSSKLQRDVIAELKLIGVDAQEEYLTQSGYRLDALIEVSGEKIAVEIDGPSHFIGRKPKGHTVLKRRQIEAIEEIRFVSVPYWEWTELKNDQVRQQCYLRSLLFLD